MKTHNPLSETGSYVCMTDIFFALSAGLLLLNALEPDPVNRAVIDAQRDHLLRRVQQAEQLVRDFDSVVPKLQLRLQEVLNEN